MSLPDLSGLCLGKPHARVAPTGANAKVIESYRGGDKELSATYRIAVVDDAPPNNPDREYPLKYDSDYEYKATYEVMYGGVSPGRKFGGVEVSDETVKTLAQHIVDAVRTEEDTRYIYTDAIAPHSQASFPGLYADAIPTHLLGMIAPWSVRDDPMDTIQFFDDGPPFLKMYLERNIEDVKGPRFILSRQLPMAVGKIAATGKRLKEGQTPGARNDMKGGGGGDAFSQMPQSEDEDEDEDEDEASGYAKYVYAQGGEKERKRKKGKSYADNVKHEDGERGDSPYTKYLNDKRRQLKKAVDPYEYYEQRKNTSMHNKGYRGLYDPQYGSKEDPIEQEGEMEALQEMIAEKLAEIRRVENSSNPSSYQLDQLKEELAELRKMVKIIAPRGPTRYCPGLDDEPLPSGPGPSRYCPGLDDEPLTSEPGPRRRYPGDDGEPLPSGPGPSRFYRFRDEGK